MAGKARPPARRVPKTIIGEAFRGVFREGEEMTEDGTLHGFLGDFWEQGMEEAPWLIFQDAAFCEGSREGWEREGMHRFSRGGELTIFAPDGSVLWSGVFEVRAAGVFTKLYPGGADWHPEGVDQETWRSFFRHDPPLRATYRPPT